MDSQFLNRDHQPSRLHLLAEAADPRARLAALDREIARYCDAIAEGVFSPALAARLAAAETEKASLLTAPASPRRGCRAGVAGHG
jgi:hypothetical protein